MIPPASINDASMDRRKADVPVSLGFDAAPWMMWSATSATTPLAGGAWLQDRCFNRRWLTYTGLTAEQARSQWRDRIHPQDLPAYQKAVEDATRLGTGCRTEYRLLRHDGRYRWIAEEMEPDAGATSASLSSCYLACCMDVTSQRERESLLRERNEDLAREAREKDEFLAMLSHELRNPLAAIASALAVMRNYHIADPLVAKNRSILERQFDSLSGVVNDLLDVARLAHGKLSTTWEQTSLDAVIERAIELSGPRIEAHAHTLKVSRPAAPVALHGDSKRLAQAVSNLLNNAAKFTPPQGVITLSAGREGDRLFLRVQDNGSGIDPAFRPRLFQLFAQDDTASPRTQGGLGIGLAVSKAIAALHGGTIDVDSEGRGRGSSFTLYLPAESHPGETELSAPHQGAGVHHNEQFRILLIDDNEDANESMSSLLKLLHYDVRTANDADSALRTTKEFAPHLILSDIGLPGMDGYQLAPALRKAAGNRKLILAAATGYGLASDRSRSQEAGFDYHLVKPLDADALIDFIAQQAAAY